MKRDLADALAVLESAGDTITYKEAIAVASDILRAVLSTLNPTIPDSATHSFPGDPQPSPGDYECARCAGRFEKPAAIHSTPYGYLCAGCLGFYISGAWPTE